MLKNFMQSDNNPTPATPKPDPLRSNQAYGSTAFAASAKAVEPAKAEPMAEPKAIGNDDGSKLIVGPNIKLKGSEITDCEILVVEGRVEASMNSRDIRIAEGGVFSGKAEIDVAEVRGCFEGDLTARKRLVIYSTGRVSGTIRYGAMMVEEGGTISGDVATLAAGAEVKAVDTLGQAKLAELVHDHDSNSEQTTFGSLQNRQAGKR
jgi:cytoskeletal protein CcmA (bactofilin family)